jgi:hypothetical protein
LLGLGVKTAAEFKLVTAAVVISVVSAATIVVMMVMSIVFIATHIGLLSFSTNQNIGSHLKEATDEYSL